MLNNKWTVVLKKCSTNSVGLKLLTENEWMNEWMNEYINWIKSLKNYSHFKTNKK